MPPPPARSLAPSLRCIKTSQNAPRKTEPPQLPKALPAVCAKIIKITLPPQKEGVLAVRCLSSLPRESVPFVQIMLAFTNRTFWVHPRRCDRYTPNTLFSPLKPNDAVCKPKTSSFPRTVVGLLWLHVLSHLKLTTFESTELHKERGGASGNGL